MNKIELTKKRYGEVKRALGSVASGEISIDTFMELTFHTKDQRQEMFLFQPQSSNEFKEKFFRLINEKKQRSKSFKILQDTLDKLSKYDEPFAIEIIDNAYRSNYQGIIFSDTDVKYSNYLKAKSNIQGESNCPSRQDGKRMRTFAESARNRQG